MTRRAVCEWPSLQPSDGSEPLWADLNDDLTTAEWELLPMPNDTTVTLRQLQELIAPHVTAWNCMAVNTETGEWQDVPPPSEIGADALTYVSKRITTWLFLCLKAMIDVNLPKGASNGSDTDATATEKNTGHSTRGGRKSRQKVLHA